MTRFHRRSVLAGMAGAAIALPDPLLAITNAGARSLIDSVVADINRIIGSGKSEPAMIRDFKTLFDRYADNPFIAAFTLGRAAASNASSRQKRAYSDAFSHYMSRKYGKRFREFIGGSIDVQRVRAVKSWYEVDTIVRLRGKAPFQVTFKVWDRSGKDLMFDMVIEGVSLRVAEKEEVGALLERYRNDINAVIAALNQMG